jgi:hypothetical protein
MSPTVDTPPVSPGRTRLKSYNQQRGSKTGFSVAGAFLFGSVFVAAGVPIALIGLHVIRVDPSTVHAPYWVIVVCGACFAGGGFAVWGMAAKQLRAEHHRREAMQHYAGSAAHADYAWNPGGYTPPRWGRAAQALIAAGFFTVFLSIFNWWAWGVPHSPWLVKVVVVLFDAVVVLVWWKTALTVGRCAKFAGSKLVFAHFPYRLNEPVAVRWIPPRGLTHAEKGTITFRCIEEYYEERGTGNDRSRWLVHDELCAETQSFETPRDFPAGRPVELRYTIPANARATNLSSKRPVYWELEVKLSMAGLDFEEWYLVPVYPR